MPTYEFRCPDGHDFEKFYRSIGAAPTEVLCPTCGKVAGRQLSAGGGLLFKGSGFYITDYGKDGKKSQAAVPAKGGDSTKPPGDTSAKSESGAADKGSGPGTGDAGSSSATTEPKSAPAPAKKPKTTE
jgi:putative FmdB family regulatory protein